MKWRSIEFRLAGLFSLLLLAGLASLGAVLWFGVQYNMVSAVDSLLEARATNLAKFVESEFGNVFVESRGDGNQGEFRGPIERVDPDRRWIVMRGARIGLRPDTKFEGSARSVNLRAGQFGEVEVERTSANSDWAARTVAVVTNLPKELKETLGEYVQAAPDGRFIQLRAASGEIFLPAQSGPEWNAIVPWQDRPPGFSTLQAPDGAYRTLHRKLSMPGGSYRLQVSLSLAALSATRRGLLQWIGWAIPVTILLSLAGGYLISRAALRPLETFAGVANRITAHRLSERLEAPGTGDVIDRLARTFNSMLERLESSVKRLDEFTADASHELRGPVTVIRTTAELALRQGRADGDLRKDLGEIQTEAVRLTDLIEQLLTLARSDGNLHAPPMTDLNLTPIVTEVSEQFRKLAGPRVRTMAGEKGWLVRGHAVSLRRLLLILVDNALRHNTEESSVVISVGDEEGRLVLAVADNGQGIPEGELPRLFDRFYRVDASRSRANGAGLGLSIAKWIVECHGGTITVSSQLGKGSTFRVSLPLQAPAAPTPRVA